MIFLSLILNLIITTSSLPPIESQYFRAFNLFESKYNPNVGLGSYSAHFGKAISTDGNSAIIGSPDYARNKGAASYVEFDGNNWTITHTFLLDDGIEGDLFGKQVALTDDKALIYGKDAIYFYQLINSKWEYKSKIQPVSIQSGDSFGQYSLVAENNTLMVGAMHDDDAGPNYGAVYVFEYDGTGWIESQKITHPNLGHLGFDIDIQNNRALVSGLHKFERYGVGVFYEKLNGIWTEKQIITPNQYKTGGWGPSVSLDGSRALIGTFNLRQNVPGATYLYEFDGAVWSKSHEFLPFDQTCREDFGQSILLSNNNAFVKVSNCLYSFYFDGINWQQSSLKPSPTTNFSGFEPLALIGDKLLVGLPYSDEPYSESGSVNIYLVDNTDLTQEFTLILNRGSNEFYLGSKVLISGDQAFARTAEFTIDYKRKNVINNYQWLNNTWQHNQEIKSMSNYEYLFGTDFDLDNQFLVVSDANDDSYFIDAGTVNVYEKDNGTWTLQQQLFPSNTTPTNSNFGHRIAIKGNTIVANWKQQTDNNENFDTVFVFEYDGVNWLQSQKLSVQQPASFNKYGENLAMNNSAIFISAELSDSDNESIIYVFTFDGVEWVESQSITITNNHTNKCSSIRLAANENTLFISNRCQRPNGVVHVYNNLNGIWVETQSLSTSDSSVYLFGEEVLIDNQVALITTKAQPSLPEAAVFIFQSEGNSWQQKQKITKPIVSTFNNFSPEISASLSEDFLLIGDPNSDWQGRNSGSVYFFKQHPDLIFTNSFEFKP